MIWTEGWLEIDKHYSLELCFSIEKQPVGRGRCVEAGDWRVVPTPPEGLIGIMSPKPTELPLHSSLYVLRCANVTSKI